MVDSNIAITSGSGTNIDTRTESTNSQHRQVIVIGDPSVNVGVAEVRFSQPDSDDPGVVVRDPNTTAIVSGLRDVRVQSLVDGTVSVENITRVRNVVDGTLSTVYRVANVVDGTLSTVTGVDRVRNLVDGTISSGTLDYVTRVRNLVDGTLTTVGTVNALTNVTRVDRVFNLVDGTVTYIPTVQRVQNLVDGTISSGTLDYVTRVRNLVDGTISTVAAVTNITNSIAVHVLSTGGTINVALKTGAILTSPGHTASIFTTSGSTSGVSASGVQLVAPSANYNFKVFAFSLTTTALVQLLY